MSALRLAYLVSFTTPMISRVRSPRSMAIRLPIGFSPPMISPHERLVDDAHERRARVEVAFREVAPRTQCDVHRREVVRVDHHLRNALNCAVGEPERACVSNAAGRTEVSEAGGAHSRDGLDPLKQIAIGPIEPLGRAWDTALVAAAWLDPDHEHGIPIETAILSVERPQAAHEQARPEQQKEAERHLRYDKSLPGTEPATSANRAACLALDARDHVHSRSPQSGYETAQDTGENRDDGGERQDPRVRFEMQDDGCPARRHEGYEQARRPSREQEAAEARRAWRESRSRRAAGGRAASDPRRARGASRIPAMRDAARASTRLATLAQAIRRTTPTTAIRMRSGCENWWRRLEIPVAAGPSPSRSGMSWGCSPRLAGLVYMGSEHVQAGHDRLRLWCCVFGFQSSDNGEPERSRYRLAAEPVLGGRHDSRLHHDRHPDIRRPSDLEPEEFARGDADDCERRSRQVKSSGR